MPPPSDRPTVSRIPAPPSGASYGRLLTELLRIHGARPPNSGRAGERWTFKELSDAVGFNDKEAQQVRRFAKDRELPTPERHTLIEAALFGTVPSHYAAWRVAMRAALGAGSVDSTTVAETALQPGPAETPSLLDPAAAEAAVGSQLPPRDRHAPHIPFRLPFHLISRNDDLARIHATLSTPAGRAALHGGHGAGKTTLAADYVATFGHHFNAIAWINSETPETCARDLVAFGRRHGFAAESTDHATALAATLAYLTRTGSGVLLVYDNAVQSTALHPFLPGGTAARVLITSTSPSWRAEAEPLAITPWSAEDGADLLLRRTPPPTDQPGAMQLSEELGNLPIALDLAAAYCERRSLSFDRYRQQFLDDPMRYLRIDTLTPSYPRSILRAFELAIDAARSEHPVAPRVLGFLSTLAPDPIPLPLVTAGIHGSEAEILDILAALRNFALIATVQIGDIAAVEVHRLIRHVAFHCLRQEERAAMPSIAFKTLDAVHPILERHNNEALALARALSPHVGWMFQHHPAAADPDRAPYILIRRADGQRFDQEYGGAMDSLRLAYWLGRRRFGKSWQCELVAQAIGETRLLLGHLDQAERALRHAVMLIERKHGATHSDLVDPLHQLARIALLRRQFTKSSTFLNRAIGIAGSSTPRENAKLAQLTETMTEIMAATLTATMAILAKRGETTAHLELHRSHEQLLQPAEPDGDADPYFMARRLIALADSSSRTSRHDIALGHVRRAAEALAGLPPDHGDVLSVRICRARVLRHAGKSADAVAELKELLRHNPKPTVPRMYVLDELTSVVAQELASPLEALEHARAWLACAEALDHRDSARRARQAISDCAAALGDQHG